MQRSTIVGVALALLSTSGAVIAQSADYSIGNVRLTSRVNGTKSPLSPSSLQRIIENERSGNRLDIGTDGIDAQSSAARAELAPTGKLRVGLFNRNPVYVTEDRGGSDVEGVAPELGRELATRLGVAFEAIRYPNIIRMLEGAKSSEWDVAFLGIDPTRAVDLDYAGAYMEDDYTYLVAADSPIRSIGDADRPGHRIVVARGGVGDLFLTRSLKQAELLRVLDVTPSTLELLSSGDAEAVVWNRSALLRLSVSLPGSRVVEGRFHGAPLGVAVIKGRPVGTAYVASFIEAAKASGLVQQAIQRANLHRVTAAASVSK